MKIAGIMQVRNYNQKWKAFEQLKAITDFTIVLDDRSILESPKLLPDLLLSVDGSQSAKWNCTANLTTLFYWAHVMGADWVIRMDDDMILCETLAARDHIELLIAEYCKCDIINVALRDLWEGMSMFRFDGIWGQKQFPLITKNWFKHHGYQLPDPNKRLHQTIFPPNLTPRTAQVSYKTVYHTGCMSLGARLIRVNKYAHEDPNGEHQSDYSYILNEHGLLLAGVPRLDVVRFNQLLT